MQKGSVDFTWTPDLLTVRNLVLESDGLLESGGRFHRARAADRRLFQNRRGGLNGPLGQPDRGRGVFDLPSRDGYAWTTMHLTGPVNNPHEDLTGRLATSAEQAIAHKAKEGTDAVLDTASGLLDLLKTH